MEYYIHKQLKVKKAEVMLERINSSEALKKLENKELLPLCEEIRKEIIDAVSKNGGHLGSNLGIVETVVAVHRVFDTPNDTLIFDVGHQCYAHKLLTGRYDRFSTLRTEGGISGFVSATESEYDPFTEGHSGTSLSQALGVAASNEILGRENYVIAIVGDGSFTNGMIYEALNNCRSDGKRLIIILNDNEMSISKNVGGLSSYLTKIRTSKKYFSIKHNFKKFFRNIPYIGKPITSGARKVRDLVKRVLVSENLFECMGIDYIGTVNGNDVFKMQTVLEEAKTKGVCTLIHIHTKKGKGYTPAEEIPEKYHSTGAFHTEKGIVHSSSNATFSSVFGDTVCALAEKDERICTVTAAMEEGTGLLPFKEKFAKRFFDVGIAEEHAVTFGAGLSKGGLVPIVAMYSTFSQRVYDQLQHDVAIQSLPFVLCLDRAGAVEGDGITHQGIFDVSEFSGIPDINIFSPETYGEFADALGYAVANKKFNVIRYPKGSETEYDRSCFTNKGAYSTVTVGSGKCTAAALTYGRITKAVYEGVKEFSEKTGITVKLIKLIKIFPLCESELEKELEGISALYFAEEGIESGGIGEKTAAFVSQKLPDVKVKIRAVCGFIPHGSLSSIMEKLGFEPKQIAGDLAVLYRNTLASKKEKAVSFDE